MKCLALMAMAATTLNAMPSEIRGRVIPHIHSQHAPVIYVLVPVEIVAQEPKYRLIANKKSIQRAYSYEYKTSPNRGQRFKWSRRYQINASSDRQRFFDQSSKAAKINPVACGDRREGLRHLALGRTGAGV